jgi:hypothetical protein
MLKLSIQGLSKVEDMCDIENMSGKCGFMCSTLQSFLKVNIVIMSGNQFFMSTQFSVDH